MTNLDSCPPRRAAAAMCGLALLAALSRDTWAQTAPPASRGMDAGPALRVELAALKGGGGVAMAFVCEKRVVALDTPLVSGGSLWAKSPQRPTEAPALRLATQWPYVSELILADRKVYARSQHETAWTSTPQSARPGLTAVMLEIGSWSTGAAGHLEWFAVARAAGNQGLPARPRVPSTGDDAPGTQAVPADPAPPAERFVLTPVNQDLLISVKRLTLGFASGPAAPGGDGKAPVVLAFAEIVTAQNDITRYWFFQQKTDAALPADIFEPSRSAAVGGGVGGR